MDIKAGLLLLGDSGRRSSEIPPRKISQQSRDTKLFLRFSWTKLQPPDHAQYENPKGAVFQMSNEKFSSTYTTIWHSQDFDLSVIEESLFGNYSYVVVAQ